MDKFMFNEIYHMDRIKCRLIEFMNENHNDEDSHHA